MKNIIICSILILISFLFIPKVDAQTISQILYGYDFLYQVYENDLTNEVRSQNIFANGKSNIPIMVLSRKYTQLSSLYGNEMSFSFNVSSGTTAIGYNASITFTIATNGVNISEFIGNGLTGYFRFSQGTLKSETSKVSIVSKTTNSLTLTINSRGTLETSTSLKSAYIYLNANNLYGIYYCAGSGFPNGCGYGTSSNTLNVQLKNINLDVEFYEDVNSTILGGIESEVSDINDKLDNNNQIQQETNNKLDNIYESDLSDTDKEKVDDTTLNEYENAENDVLDQIKDVNLDNIDISMDLNSTNFIWDLITDIFNSHPLIMSTVIAILSIGIIKLALGR